MSLIAAVLSGYDPKFPACPITAGLEYSSVQKEGGKRERGKESIV